jgi:Domain of unknown function (DUF4432)
MPPGPSPHSKAAENVPRACIGHADQVALVRSGNVVDVRVYGGIDVRIHPARGFDIGAAWFRGIPLAWIAPAGEGGKAGATWRDSWGGGLVTTCGLDNVGEPSEGVGQHGTFTFLEAEGVRTERKDTLVTCGATLHDPRGLRIERTISTTIGEGRVELVDRTTNLSGQALEAPLLYHVNLGWPLWDEGARVETAADDVLPRDEDTGSHDWRTAPAPASVPERVWEHLGATRASVTNERLGVCVTVDSNLPRLWQWVDPPPGVYVLGLEPANCSVLGRAHDRGEGRLPLLVPGETRRTTLVVTADVV